MTGLLGYVAAGALAGVGQGIVEQARMLREESLANARTQERHQEREADFERQKDLIDYRDGIRDANAAGKSGGGKSGSRKAAPAAASGGASTDGEKLVGWSVGEDGIAYGRNKSGEMKPYRGPDGKPWKESVKGSAAPRTSAPAAINKAPDVMSEAPAAPEQPAAPAPRGPSVGTVVEGHRFLGGDPNDMNSWQKVSS